MNRDLFDRLVDFSDDGDGGLRFVSNPEPSDFEVVKLLASISRRITRLVRRRGTACRNPGPIARVMRRYA